MQDVAARANVSKTAVSLAFNDSSRLSVATLQNIMNAATELGYSQDPAARMLRTRRTDSLGLLLPQQLDNILENPYYPKFMQGVGQTCQREGFTLLLAPPLRGSMLKTIPYAAVDGFIVSGLEDDRGEVTALRQRGIPFVLVDSVPTDDDIPSVEIEDGPGMASLVSHLLDLGHRRIAFVSFDSGIEGGYQHWRGSIASRLKGAAEALAGRGMTLESEGIDIIEVPCTRDGGVDAFKELWGRPDRPTAMVAFSDIIALGIMDAAADAGISVPQDLSVTGFDDLPEAVWSRPALTTVRQPIETKGRLAADYLVESITSTTSRDHHLRLHTTLLIRESTGPAQQR